MPLAAAISAAGSLLGGIFSSNQSVKNQKMAIEAQRQENEKNRVFNAEQAKLARQYNTSMWNAQNDYNDPSAVQQRLSKAGIHPALAYTSGQTMGSISMGNTGMDASYGTGLSTPLPDVSGYKEAFSNASDSFSRMVESREAESRTKLNEIEQGYKEEWARGEIANMAADTGVKVATQKLTEEEQNRVAQVCYNLRTENDFMKAQLDNMNEDTIGKYLDNCFKDIKLSYAEAMNNVELRKAILEAKLTEQQVDGFIEYRRAELSLMAAQRYAAIASGNASNASADYSSQLARGEKMMNDAVIKINGRNVGRGGVALLSQYYSGQASHSQARQYEFNIDNFWDAKQFDAGMQIGNWVADKLFGLIPEDPRTESNFRAAESYDKNGNYNGTRHESSTKTINKGKKSFPLNRRRR